MLARLQTADVKRDLTDPDRHRQRFTAAHAMLYDDEELERFPFLDRTHCAGADIDAAAEYGNALALLSPLGLSLYVGVDPVRATGPAVVGGLSYGVRPDATDWTGRTAVSWVCSQRGAPSTAVLQARDAMHAPLCGPNVRRSAALPREPAAPTSTQL